MDFHMLGVVCLCVERLGAHVAGEIQFCRTRCGSILLVEFHVRLEGVLGAHGFVADAAGEFDSIGFSILVVVFGHVAH